MKEFFWQSAVRLLIVRLMSQRYFHRYPWMDLDNRSSLMLLLVADSNHKPDPRRWTNTFLRIWGGNPNFCVIFRTKCHRTQLWNIRSVYFRYTHLLLLLLLLAQLFVTFHRIRLFCFRFSRTHGNAIQLFKQVIFLFGFNWSSLVRFLHYRFCYL